MKPKKRKARKSPRPRARAKKRLGARPPRPKKKAGASRIRPGASRVPVTLSYSPPHPVLSALRRLRGHRVIITAHSLADTDAVASSAALAEWLGPRAVHALADRANSEARRLLPDELHAALPFSQARGRWPSAPILLLDANDPALLPHLSGERIELIIDHHAISADSVRARAEWVEPRAASCSELVASIIGHAHPQAARALALGILSDSAQLLRAEPPTLRALASLLEHCDCTHEQLLEQLRQPAKPESRAAVLEGLRQSAWRLEGGWLLASSSVSSHESHVADALISAGADAAFVGSADANGARLSARLRPRLASRTDLPGLMREVGRFLGGMGGGHPAAAGARGPKGERLGDALILAQRLLMQNKF